MERFETFSEALLLTIFLIFFTNHILLSMGRSMSHDDEDEDRWLLDIMEAIPRVQAPALGKLNSGYLGASFFLDYVAPLKPSLSVRTITAPLNPECTCRELAKRKSIRISQTHQSYFSSHTFFFRLQIDREDWPDRLFELRGLWQATNTMILEVILVYSARPSPPLAPLMASRA